MTLPTVVMSSVVRSAVQGESHGGVYLVNLESGATKQVVDWNNPDISWEGRGWDRGLRGIDIHGDRVFLAAGDEIFVYDPTFRRIESFRNRYLKHCHEIFIFDDKLYLTSTGFDSILEFDLRARRFSRGMQLMPAAAGRAIRIRTFDPGGDNGPPAEINEFHITNIPTLYMT